MRKLNNIMWGIALLAVGVVIALKALGVTDESLWFDGWWTLFILVPSFIGLVTERDKTGSIIGLCVGVMLLLGAQDIIDFSLVWKLIVPVIIIIIALKLIFKGIFSGKAEKVWKHCDDPSVFAVFSGNDMDFTGKVFDGARLNAIFGGIQCDLRNAIIDQDCEIQICAIFGGVDILLPSNVMVNIDSTSVFGDISDKRIVASTSGVTVHIKGLCLFGGADIT